ncbi:MAG: MotA/TolQ/ExbB proton channel family protein [Candidatus Binatia bacterium]
MFQLVDLIIKGGPVMVPLLACSVIGLAITIERFLFWRKIGSRQTIEDLLQTVACREFAKAVDLARNSQLPVARVLGAGLKHRESSFTKALEVAAQAEVPILKKRLSILDTIITLAPLLGLLGTVVGMIGSFDIMSEAGIGQPYAVTGGVAEALIAPATGLLIAILTLIPYNYFTHKAEREMEEIEYFASRLELLLSSPQGQE